MSLFHKHKWIEKERFYAPPMGVGYELERPTERLARQIIFGITTIHYTCWCGEDWFEQVLGKQITTQSPNQPHQE